MAPAKTTLSMRVARSMAPLLLGARDSHEAALMRPNDCGIVGHH
jgi:hypothetical protein